MPPTASVLLDPHFRTVGEIFSPEDLCRLYATADVLWGRDEPMPIEQATAALERATAVVCSGWRYGPLPDSDTLRAIIDVSGALPRDLDYGTCFDRGIRVLTAAPAFGPQVAEMALGLALSAAREIGVGDRAMRAGTERWLHAGNESTFQLYDQPVGFIGFGSLARNLQDLLRPFRADIAVSDPWLTAGYLRSQGVRPTELPELLRTSRVIFVLAVPSAENDGLLSRDLLELIAPGSVFVLISRAHLVDFDALTELVIAGKFKAAIDVFPAEPLALDHPIRTAESVVLSAHRAGSVPAGLRLIGQLVVDDLEAIVKQLPPRRLQQADRNLVARLHGAAGPA